MSRLPLTPDQAELSDRIYQALRQAAEADLRGTGRPARLQARPAAPGATEFEVRDPVHKIGAKAFADRPARAEKRGYQGSAMSCPHCHESARFVEYRPKTVQSLVGAFPPGAGLLPLPVLWHGDGPLGRGPRPVAAGVDARGPRAGLHRRRGRQLRRGRRRGAPEARRPAGLGIDRASGPPRRSARHRPAAGGRRDLRGRSRPGPGTRTPRGRPAPTSRSTSPGWGCKAPTAAAAEGRMAAVGMVYNPVPETPHVGTAARACAAVPGAVRGRAGGPGVVGRAVAAAGGPGGHGSGRSGGSPCATPGPAWRTCCG